MDVIEKETITELRQEILDDVDPLYVLPALYERFDCEFCTQLKEISLREDRAERLMEVALSCMTLDDLLSVFAFQNAYLFLDTRIQNRLKEKHQNLQVCHTIKSNMFTTNRKILVNYRHKLKMFSLSGDQESFDKEVDFILNLWENVSYRKSLVIQKQQSLAEKYFYARDAQCENRRLQYDQSLANSEIISEMLAVAPYTTNPTLATMMHLARKGSALIMADSSRYDEAFKLVQFAEQNTELVQTTRETGNVFCIKYNFCYLKYEKLCKNDPKSKTVLFKIAEKAVSAFSTECETVAKDFQNIFRIKLAHLCLGIGVLGNNIPWVVVTPEDIQEAETRLNELKIESLSTRWKWGFYIAKAKIQWLNGDLVSSLKEAKKAIILAKKGRFKTEIQGTEEAITSIKAELANCKKVIQQSLIQNGSSSKNRMMKNKIKPSLTKIFLVLAIIVVLLAYYIHKM